MIAAALGGLLVAGGVSRASAQGAWTEELSLESAPHDAPAGAPSAVVHAPPGFDPNAPLWVVVFLHGWRGCARVLAHPGSVRCAARDRPRPGWDLVGRFDEAGANALLVIPQLAFLTRDGSAGRFRERGRFAAFLAEALAGVEGRLGAARRPARITLLAHSAGFETALAVLARGEAPEVRDVVLFDALYRGHVPFAEWALADPARRLISIHGREGRTASQSAMLARLVAARGGPGVAATGPDASPADARVVVRPTDVPHGDVPARCMGEVLRALGSPARGTIERGG